MADNLSTTRPIPRIKLELMAGENMLSGLAAPSMYTEVLTIDSDDNNESIEPESSSGETIYHDQLATVPIAHAPLNHAMLRDLEGKWDNMQLVTIVRRSCQQIKKLPGQKEKRAQEQSDKIDIILEELSRARTITARFTKKIDLKRVLDVLRLPARGFSAVTNEIAEGLFQEFERQNWGESPTPMMFTTAPEPNSVAPGRSNTSRRRMPLNASSTVPATVSAAPELQDEKTVLCFDEDHPIFGNDGVMHGINVRLNMTTKKRSYFLDKSKHRPHTNIVGHNGCNVGDCWAYQICLVRDSVHGCPQAGIYGNEASGAYSIIVLGSSAYGDIDIDSGSKILYSGSGSLENSDPEEPKITQGTKALRTSALKKQAVRVIRGKNDKMKTAPKAGFRYDGLYEVVGEKELMNGKGGAFIQFELQRLSNQPPIDKSRPDLEEQKVFQEIKDEIRKEIEKIKKKH